MAMRLINGAIFLHIPKTGGDWITQVLADMELLDRSCFHKHATFDRVMVNDSTFTNRKHWGPLPEDIERNVFTFCFVRNPIEWYISHWRYTSDMTSKRWGGTGPGDVWHPLAALNDCWADSFDSFLQNVCEQRPGFVTELFSQYAQPGINFTGHTEYLMDDLIKVLDIMGIEYDRAVIRNASRLNASQTPRPSCSAATIARATELELAAFIRYGYGGKST